MKKFTIAGRTARVPARAAVAIVAAVLASAALAGCSGAGKKVTSSPPTATSSTEASAATIALPSGDPNAPAPAPAATSTTSPPVRVAIPSIGVTSTLQALGLEKDGTLQSPTQWQQAGWYSDGVRPGDPGPAVIAGHVDSVSGPAIFYRLTKVVPGDTATVTQADGRVLTFVVDTVREYPKNKFPSAAVYGPTALPVLRLITCTGDFDQAAHSYVDNLVVSAHLQS